MGAVLNDISIFNGLSQKELETITSHSVVRIYRKNTVILNRGGESSSLYVILTGKIKVYISDEEGKEIVLNIQGPGAHFGELALLGGQPRSASVMTLDESKIMILTKSAFLTCLSAHPNIALNLIHSLVNRVCELTDNVSDFALLDIYGRVVKMLLRNAEDHDGQLAVENLTQQDIAGIVGASRTMVNRIFKDLKVGGYIALEGRRIVIRKKLPAHW